MISLGLILLNFVQAVLKKEAFNLVVSDKISYTREVSCITMSPATMFCTMFCTMFVQCFVECLHHVLHHVCTMFCTYEIRFAQVPDTRDSRCKAVYYDKELPSTSVIIIFTNEAWSASSSSLSSSPIMKLRIFGLFCSKSVFIKSILKILTMMMIPGLR